VPTSEVQQRTYETETRREAVQVGLGGSEIVGWVRVPPEMDTTVDGSITEQGGQLARLLPTMLDRTYGEPPRIERVDNASPQES
jgi:hypothetical protein